MSFLKKLFGGLATPTPKTQPATAATQVKFIREVRKQHPFVTNIQTITKTYSAPNREAAVAFLRNQNITESFLYIEVVTPSGMFGIDRMGQIYDSGGALSGDSSDLFGGSATPTSKTLSTPSQSNTSEWKALSDTFHDAAESGDLEKVKAMLKDNPNLVFSRIFNFGSTPLHAAANNGHKQMVELLLDKGADVNVVDQNDHTPLHHTAGNGHKQVVELLLAKGANVNAKMHYDLTPLHIAASEGHKDVVELLLAKGANVNAKDEGGKTPLYKAHKDVVELLRKHGGHE